MASDSWFRMYNTAVDHPKTVTLSDAHFRAWVRLLSLASKTGGTIAPDMPLIAATLRKSPAKAEDIIKVLQGAELLDPVEGGGWTPRNWNERQFKSDVSTDRVRAFRERSRNVSETDHRQSTETETETNKDCAQARFSEFWSFCPRKEGGSDAQKAWESAIKLATSETIIEAMRRYAASRIGQDELFTLTPTNWLKKKRWTDKLPEAPRQLTPEEIEANKDRADKLLNRGKYAPVYQ